MAVSDENTAPRPSTSRRQALLDTNFFVPSRAEKDKLTDAIAVFIVTTCSPYSIVETEGFRHMMKVAVPNYDVPGRKTFSDRIIPKLYLKMRDHVKYVISRAPFVSLTMDAWTAGNKRHFLGVTCAFISEEWHLESFALACREADFSHTADNLNLLLDDVLQDFDIQKIKVVAITTDRAANMISAVSKFGTNSVPCFAHAVNTIVNKMMDHNTISPIMLKIRKTYNVFAYSANANRELATIQKEKNVDVLRMPSSCKTRWWSELGQISFVVSQEEALSKFLKHYENGKLSSLLLDHHQVRLLKGISAMLLRMEKFCESLSVESDVTASAILKSVKQIQSMLNDFRGQITDPGIAALQAHMRILADEFGQIFKDAMKETSHIDMAAYIDPRFETHNLDAMKAVVRLDALSINAHSHDIHPLRQSTDSHKSNIADLFPDDDIDTELDDTTASPIEDEIARFAGEKRLAYSASVLEWWKSRQNVYPILSQLARKYLCISATSVAIERVFSVGGAVLTKFRLSLTDEHSEQLVFMAKNQKKLPLW